VGDPFSRERIQAAYDVAADEYSVAFGDDLVRLPLDRHMLDEARRAAHGGAILDVGCGTGSAGSYLTREGAHVVGVDLSFGMLRACKRSECRYPVSQGDMRHMPFRDNAFSAAVAYYSIHNVTRPEFGRVLTEVARVLEPGGTLLTATHLGDGEVYTDRFLGHAIATTGGTLYSDREIVDQMSSRGFRIESSKQRGPLAHEHQSQRIYLLATRAV
jgi:ubiquinone/menaquinone biosynthesis C-methylase UbiE